MHVLTFTPRSWGYRAGNFHNTTGMHINHLLVTAPLKHRVVWAEIDREPRKKKPLPMDHAPVIIDIDSPGFRSMPAVACLVNWIRFIH